MQFLDDGVVRGHTLHTKRQHHGQDGGQAFRHGGHSQRDSQQQGINHVFGGGEHVGDLADLRIHTGAGHDCAAGALRHGSAVEDHVGAVAQRLGFGECVRLLANRHGFAGQ